MEKCTLIHTQDLSIKDSVLEKVKEFDVEVDVDVESEVDIESEVKVKVFEKENVIDKEQKNDNYLVIHSLHDMHQMYKEDQERVSNKKIKFYGWIRRTRLGGGGKIVFIDIYDGTIVGPLMCLATSDYYLGDIDHLSEELPDAKFFKTLSFEQLSRSEFLSDGCSVVVEGLLVLSPSNTTQLFELQIHCLRVIGSTDALTYPIQKSADKHLTTLRKLPFDRFRSQVSQSLFRIGSELEFGAHMYMHQNKVQKIDPNIITMNSCEGSGDMFTISPLIFSKDDEGKELSVGLTVSSQLPLEAAICGFKQVYTCQKSFRAEKSLTIKHLAEFLHLEYEEAFTTLNQLMCFTENIVKYMIKFAFDCCKEDFDFLESKFAPQDIKPTRKMLIELLEKPFVRIKHADAIKLIQDIVKSKAILPDDNGKMKRVKLEKMIQDGDDLGSEHEKLIVRYFGWINIPENEREERLKAGYEFDAFVFVTHWPLKIKSFYMKQCNDGSGTCESYDLLCPRVGELVGGSLRTYRFDELESEIKRRQMDITPIQWYLDLRKSGSVEHGGWGMGFARLCMLVTGVPSVRDVVPFPVYYGHCPY